MAILYSFTFEQYTGVTALPGTFYLTPISPPPGTTHAVVNSITVMFYAPLVQGTYNMQCRILQPGGSYSSFVYKDVVWSGQTTQIISFTFPSVSASISSNRFQVQVSKNSGPPYTTYLAKTTKLYFVVEGEWAGVPVPSKPTNPTPVNNAVEVDFSNFTLSWQNGGGATSYDVYIGPQYGLVKVSSGQTGTTYITNINQVPYNQKIYWRIDAINASGTTTGDVWNFDARPAKVANPVPNDNTEGVDLALNTLGWAESDLATEYDFYFREEGDNWDYVGDTEELIFDIPIVFSKYFQVYEWRIDAKNQFGITTGDTWSFIIIHSQLFPYERRSDYSNIIDNDLVWDISSQAWTSDFDYLVAGGGRYRNQLVVVGHRVIYFGDI